MTFAVVTHLQVQTMTGDVLSPFVCTCTFIQIIPRIIFLLSMEYSAAENEQEHGRYWQVLRCKTSLIFEKLNTFLQPRKERFC